MARKKHGSKHAGPALESLEEIESVAERMAQWIADNVGLVAVVVVVLLGSAGGLQTYRSHARGIVNDASNALSKVQDAYLAAMGASGGSREIPELANPAAQVGVREEFSKRFAEVAENNAGTVQAALAWLESGNLLGETGERDAAIEAWRKGLEAVPENDAIRGTLLVRIAGDHEDRGNWKEAADTHAEAANLPQYPLRFWAMADAARCFDRAGDSGRALELLERIEVEAPSLQMSDRMRALLRELRATKRSSARAG